MWFNFFIFLLLEFAFYHRDPIGLLKDEDGLSVTILSKIWQNVMSALITIWHMFT